MVEDCDSAPTTRSRCVVSLEAGSLRALERPTMGDRESGGSIGSVVNSGVRGAITSEEEEGSLAKWHTRTLGRE